MGVFHTASESFGVTGREIYDVIDQLMLVLQVIVGFDVSIALVAEQLNASPDVKSSSVQ